MGTATATVTRAKSLVIETEDKPGVLAQFMKTLRDAGVSLKGLCGYGLGGGKAVIECIPENEGQLRQACQKAGLSIKESTVFYLSGEDRAGATVEALEKAAAAGVNLRAVVAISTGNTFGAFVWADPQNADALGKVFKA